MTTTPPRDGHAPFAPINRGIDAADPVRCALRSAGPIVQVTAPAGGPAWIVTDDALAREVCAHPRIVKDPAMAPTSWDHRIAGLEQTAARQPSLTTLDGAAHARLRRAHAPLFSARRIREFCPRVHDIARRLLGEIAASGTVADLMADFTIRYPLTVLLDLLGIPLDRLDEAIEACRGMLDDEPTAQREAIAAIAGLAAAGLRDDEGGRPGGAAELRDRMPPDTTPEELHYHLFGLIFAGQLTTDASIGFLIARLLDGSTTESRLDFATSADGSVSGSRPAAEPDTVDALVRETLRRNPPAPFTLWRFTTTEIELAGVRLPARAPVLVDIQGINTDPSRSPGPDLTFGAGAHYCIGAQLALLELRAVASVLREDFPRARLTVPAAALRQSGRGGIQGTRLDVLPVALTG
ncbi:cytochrome P450 [Actinoalloteichus hoggarensis]|uniref:Vitamin D(3) 25-hydroxylase n=1 Tax=Actinoalloteichus hoggarensis TaxID=1470176 RepID=A0A221VY56_9PSEU|nr:cytochrome P450 [Actinoalloteichus hoggarensis]ASO18490.1 Vitamin D(3) 25-hydroxylase [Actinoalloteichus hoggarensis]MBB5921858.1 cytochrome P450 [Actinoalloteichus hoggarensis]